MDFTGERVVPDKMAVDPQTYQEHIARYNFAMSSCVNFNVLDVACGTGYGLDLISGVANEVHGMDICINSLNYATNMYLFNCRNHSFNVCDFDNRAFDLLFDNNTIDVVISFETIEHLERPDFFLDNIKKVLTDDGIFIFSIPNASYVPFHKTIYNLQDAQKLISKHFSHIEWYGQDYVNFGPISEQSGFFIGIAHK